MSKSDAKELNDILRKAEGDSCGPSAIRGKLSSIHALEIGSDDPMGDSIKLGGLVQWTTHDGKRFVPSSTTAKVLTPGVYEIQQHPNIGIYFEKIPVVTAGLLRFPETNSEKVVAEIQKFWNKEDVFKQYRLTYKRGIILWGPPGSGKSCTIQLIMEDVVARGGVVLRFTAPVLFTEGVRILREIQPTTPIVVLMEDIDSILEMYNESEVLNILDGVNQVAKAVFLATTNYPERLGARIINRPSRFDKRFKIGHPSAASRRIYFEYIIGGPEKVAEMGINLDKWVEDTDEFSIAHLKELFTAVTILGDDYDEAIEALSLMKEKTPTSDDDEFRPPFGLAQNQQKRTRKSKDYPNG
jgi:hypothetical protein